MRSTAPAAQPATRTDLANLPEHVVGEIIEGVLYTFPRPGPRHVDIEGLLHGDLKSPFQRGRRGPGGWWILVEPGIELPDSPEVVPDLAGWRRNRLLSLPDGPITVVPDWVCEILSRSTRGHDQRIKRPFYARVGLSYLWFVDLDGRTLSVSKLVGGRWLEIAIFGEGDRVHAEPFEVVEIDLSEWWPAATDIPPE